MNSWIIIWTHRRSWLASLSWNFVVFRLCSWVELHDQDTGLRCWLSVTAGLRAVSKQRAWKYDLKVKSMFNWNLALHSMLKNKNWIFSFYFEFLLWDKLSFCFSIFRNPSLEVFRTTYICSDWSIVELF